MVQFYKKYHVQFHYLLLCLALTGLHPLYMITSDSYFMAAHGKDILTGGLFRSHDIFSVHDNFTFMHQKWLMCIETYFVYNLFGNIGLIVMSLILFFLSIVMMAHILEFCAPRCYVINIPVLIIASFGLTMFSTYRPQLISFLILGMFVLLMEKFIKESSPGRSYYIYFFLMSLLIMWHHSTMWIFVFFFWAVYFCDSSEEFMHTKSNMIKVLGVLLLATLCQPNGIKQYAYMWNCMKASAPLYNQVVTELQSQPLSLPNICIYILTAAFVAEQLCSRKVCLRAHYMFCGAICGSLYSYRLNVYSIMLIVVAIAISNPGLKFKSIWLQRILIAGCSMFAVFHVALNIMGTYTQACYDYTINDSFGHNVVDLLSQYVDNTSDIRLCAIPADTGSYAISQGYKVYFDCRAEVYDKKINKYKDVLGEYANLISGVYKGNRSDTFIKDFQSDYDFDYYIVSTKSIFVIESLDKYAHCNYSNDFYRIYSFDDMRNFVPAS